MVAMSTVHLQDIDGHKVQVPRDQGDSDRR
jgi:hypothetical protein